jgi:DNA-binding NarL/FixJ family response regulator
VVGGGLVQEVPVFVALYNRVLQDAFSSFLSGLRIPVVHSPLKSKVSFVDKVKLSELDVKGLHSKGVNFVLVDTGLDKVELFFLVKNFPLSGIVYPEMKPELIKKCIGAVALGDKWFKRDFLVSLGKESISASSLTERELQVIGYLIEGMTNKEIARELGITEQTVKYYVNQLLKKANVSNRVKLVCLFSKLYPYLIKR